MVRHNRVSRRFPRPIVWGAVSVAVAAIAVQATRSGVDILAVLVACFLLLVLERTAGDWIADTIGAWPVAVVFSGIAIIGVAYLQTNSGRARASRLFAAAEARGYRTEYFTVSETPPAAPRAGSVAVGSARVAARTSTAPVASPSRRPGNPRQAAAAEAADSRGGQSVRSRAPRLGRLRIAPEVSVTDREVDFTVDGAAGQETILDVEFSVDGQFVGRAPFVNGVATLRWKTRVPGRYTVRVHVADGFIGSGTSAVLNVLPAGSQ